MIAMKKTSGKRRASGQPGKAEAIRMFRDLPGPSRDMTAFWLDLDRSRFYTAKHD
jgi:hypothetical protein